MKLNEKEQSAVLYKEKPRKLGHPECERGMVKRDGKGEKSEVEPIVTRWIELKARSGSRVIQFIRVTLFLLLLL